MTSQPTFIPSTPLGRPSISPIGSTWYMCDKPASKPPSSGSSPSRKPLKTIKSNASWANTFFREIGVKGPGSRPHWDLRPKSLRPEDEGSGVCDNCKGTGLMTCTFCNGANFYAEEGANPESCPACAGKSEMTCSVCFGTRKQIELEGQWWKRGVEAFFGK